MTTQDPSIIDLIRSGLDALVALHYARVGRGKELMEHEERAALRLRQALELLEGTGGGGFDSDSTGSATAGPVH